MVPAMGRVCHPAPTVTCRFPQPPDPWWPAVEGLDGQRAGQHQEQVAQGQQADVEEVQPPQLGVAEREDDLADERDATSVQSARRPARPAARPTIGAHSQTRYWGDKTLVGRTKAKVPRVKAPAQSAGPSPPEALARRQTSQAAAASPARVATKTPDRLELRS